MRDVFCPGNQLAETPAQSALKSVRAEQAWHSGEEEVRTDVFRNPGFEVQRCVYWCLLDDLIGFIRYTYIEIYICVCVHILFMYICRGRCTFVTFSCQRGRSGAHIQRYPQLLLTCSFMICPRFDSFTLGSWKIQILLSKPRGYLEGLKVAGLFPLASSNLFKTSNELS